jgi:imidazole glycerol-phosphate synthase subunit HisF
VWDSPQSLEAVARDLGTQAVIAHLPVRMGEDGLKALDYRDRIERPLSTWLERLPLEWVSELMVTDWSHEGSPGGFDERLLTLAQLIDKPLLCFGGISEVAQLHRVLTHPTVVAAGVGNFLSYQEHAVQTLKKLLGSNAIRAPHYESTL